MYTQSLAKFSIDFDEKQHATTTCCIVDLFYMINIQERELYLDDFVKHIFDISLHLDTYQPISFKRDMMLDATKLQSVIPVLSILNFLTQSQEAMGKLELVL